MVILPFYKAILSRKMRKTRGKERNYGKRKKARYRLQKCKRNSGQNYENDKSMFPVGTKFILWGIDK